jgi:hypothetical protein
MYKFITSVWLLTNLIYPIIFFAEHLIISGQQFSNFEASMITTSLMITFYGMFLSAPALIACCLLAKYLIRAAVPISGKFLIWLIAVSILIVLTFLTLSACFFQGELLQEYFSLEGMLFTWPAAIGMILSSCVCYSSFKECFHHPMSDTLSFPEQSHNDFTGQNISNN